MSKWFTRLPKEFRTELQSYGKSYEGIEKACLLLIKTLDILHKRQKKLNDARLENAIEELKEHFDFCKDFATGKIKKEEWADFDFDGDLVGLFNDYMTEFWDICDWITNDKQRYDFDAEKFCWVEL
jgi:hypothetical protein